jgi:hypothetical protein
MAFGAKQGTNYEGLSIASLPPGIYKNVEIVNVELTKTTKSDGSEGKDILTILFRTPEGDHQHTEFDIDPTDAKYDSKSDNLVKRGGHILTKFVSDEAVATNNATDFKSYAQWFINTLGQHFRGVKTLELKITGSVYNKEAKSAIPGYPPFIARTDHPKYKPLSFSARENQDNQAYFKHVNAAPDPDGDLSTSNSSDGRKYDTDF